METKYANIKGGQMSVGNYFKVTLGGMMYCYKPSTVLGIYLAKQIVYEDIDKADYKLFGGYIGEQLWMSTSGSVIWMPLIRPSEISSTGDIYSFGNISCLGTKSRIADTDNFGQKKLYCYEMASPMFGDCGTASTDDAGECYISIDPIFAEMIEQEPVVKLTKYGLGDLYVCLLYTSPSPRDCS